MVVLATCHGGSWARRASCHRLGGAAAKSVFDVAFDDGLEFLRDRIAARDQRRAPYVAALKPFAAEFGRGVREAGESLEFEALRDGQRVEVSLDLRPGGGIAVRSSPPARQSLSWFRPPAAAPSRAAGWREVERTERWQLRAELPAMARPLLADTGLMEVVHAFFTSHRGTAVTHTVSGMEIDAELSPADAVGAQVRVCVEMAFRLRRLNG